MSLHAATRQHEQGFTLVETLIAVFALALMMAAGSAMLLSALSGQEQLRDKSAEIAALDQATALLRSDLGNAIPRVTDTGRAGEGERSLYGGRPGRDGVVLGLVRAGWTNVDAQEDRSELLAVEYLLDENGTLLRRAYRRPDRVRATVSEDMVLLQDLQSLGLTFFGGGQPAAQWGLVPDSTTVQMPDAVEVSMAFGNGEVLVQRFPVGGRPE